MPTKTTKPKKEIIESVVEEEIESIEPVVAESADTITFRRSHVFIVAIALTFVFGLMSGYILRGSGILSQLGFNSETAGQIAGPISEAPVATSEPQYVRYEIPTEGYPALGPANAPITLVEFSDFQCPFCKRWHDEVYESLLIAYPGQIRLVYRNLPLTSIHPDAYGAAQAAMCANDQDAFWAFHDKLFAGELLGVGAYTQYAEELSLNRTAFETCIAEDRHKEFIDADSSFAIDLGINSTPTFFINGLAVVGAQPLTVFQEIIDKELAGEIP